MKTIKVRFHHTGQYGPMYEFVFIKDGKEVGMDIADCIFTGKIVGDWLADGELPANASVFKKGQESE